ncbi:MAG: hypothetical protein KDI16_06415 [Halioglobus sp.]|nr:hypothetical protein [Halioglobus sp.]
MSAYPEVPGPDPDADPLLAQLLLQLRERHHQAICCALLYGSCLRSGDICDGLLDVYLICDSYRCAYRRALPAAANWLLPPNVYYAEVEAGSRTLRSKVTVISLGDFRRGCSPAWFESYIWGRFAQPTRIVYSRDTATRERVAQALLQAAHTLLTRAVPALPARGAVTELWQRALALSYATELRTERSARAAELARSSADFYAALTRHCAGTLNFPFAVYAEDGQLCYASQCSPVRRRWCTLAWGLRRAQGKLLSVARLLKGLFTFSGGLDYVAWKLERHTGEPVVIPARVRRAPLLFLWGFFWKLYRRGLFK